MLKPIPKFVIISLVSSLISSSPIQAMEKDDPAMGASSTSQRKKTMGEAASHAEADKRDSYGAMFKVDLDEELKKLDAEWKKLDAEWRKRDEESGWKKLHEVWKKRDEEWMKWLPRVEPELLEWIKVFRIKDTGRTFRNNLFNLEESKNFFGIHNYKTYNHIIFCLDNTIHQLIYVFIYTLNSVYKAFDNYYHSPQCDKEEFRNIINSYFSGFSGFVENLYGLISSRIVYSACDLLTHNDPNLKVMALKNRNIDDKEVQRICTILSHNQYLEELILDSNKITDIGVSYICSLLRKKTNLKKLSLCNNQVTSVGLKAISNALKHNTNLISLCMGGNLILRHELCKVESVNGPVNQLTAIHPHEDRLIKKFVTFLEEYFINKIQAQRIDFKETDPQMELEWIR